MTTTTAAQDFALVPADVTDAGRYIQQTAQALIDGIRGADTEVAGLMSTWRGPAADAYLAGWEETRRGGLACLEALHDMGALLGVAVASVAEIDQARADATVTSSLDLP